MEVKADPSKGKLKICSESFRGGYEEECMVQLRKMMYGDQDITMNFRDYIINHI
jgi:hypothetical protein